MYKRLSNFKRSLLNFESKVLPISKLQLFIAKNNEEQTRGLIGVDKEEFSDNSILLFTNVTGSVYFHMKGVKFPIEIMFLDENFNIIEKCELNPETGLVKSPENTCYAIEANIGFSDSIIKDKFLLELKKALRNG